MICKTSQKNNIFKLMQKRKIASQQNQDNFENKMVTPPPSRLCAGGPGWGILRAIMVEKTIES